MDFGVLRGRGTSPLQILRETINLNVQKVADNRDSDGEEMVRPRISTL